MSANPDTETQIYQWLSQQGNKSGAIKALIEKEIAGQENELRVNYKTLASMNRHIARHKERFGLFFIECDSHKRREDLLRAFDGTYGSNSITVDYEAFKHSQMAYLDEWLIGLVTKERQRQDIVALNIVGFDDLLEEDEDMVFALLNNINWRRSNFKKLDLPLFFWTTNKVVTKIAKYAPDFFDWHTDVLVLDQET